MSDGGCNSNESETLSSSSRPLTGVFCKSDRFDRVVLRLSAPKTVRHRGEVAVWHKPSGFRIPRNAVFFARLLEYLGLSSFVTPYFKYVSY